MNPKQFPNGKLSKIVMNGSPKIILMELQNKNDGWYLAFRDGLVQLIQIDFRLGIFFSDATDKAQLFVETPCRLLGPDADASIVPAETASVAPILPFFNAKVVGIDIRKTGQLIVEFKDGHVLEVHPDNSYEAWQLSCSPGVMLICSPGGKVSLFRDAKRDKQKT
jgi:hypothetical protein